jgi:SAM-dependent methyltransferase
VAVFVDTEEVSSMLTILRKTLKILLPKSTVYYLKHGIERYRFNHYLKPRLDMNFQPVESGAVPPKKLIAKTAALNEQELEKQSNPNVYFQTGYYEVLRMLKIIEHFSINLRTLGSIMELGCGTARLLRHFRCFEGVRLVGSDANLEMIQWCKNNLSGIEFYDNDLEPPLSFAEDNSFDLVIASSVFTHIPLHLQEVWLKEMRRILRPNGIFICSVLGKNHQRWVLDSQDIIQLRQKGSLTFSPEDKQAAFSTRIGGSRWDVFQTRAEVIRVFGSFFQIIDYIPGGQDFLVLRKNDFTIPLAIASVPFPAEKV